MSDQATQEQSSGFSLQVKFVGAILFTVALAVFPVTLASSGQIQRISRAALMDTARSQLQILQGMLFAEHLDELESRANRLLPVLSETNGTQFVSLRKGDRSEVVTVFNSHINQDLLDRQVLREISGPEHLWSEDSSTTVDHEIGATLVVRLDVYASTSEASAEGSSRTKIGELWMGLDPVVRQAQLIEGFERSLAYILITSVLVISLAMFLFTREFLRPIRGLLFGANRLAEGDLDYQVILDSTDELGRLAEAFNTLSKTIRTRLEDQRELVSQVERIVRRLGNSTSAILSVVSQQVSGAGQQASSVHHVSSTAEEIAASSRSVAETAKTMGMAANETVSACEHGKTEVDEAISGIRAARETVTGIASSMERLGADSRKIGEILKLIEGISEQTNLLALNAAIEAAGAGEAGQRFAIVATEVKRLATRTNESTKEIRDLISTIQNSTNKAIMLTEEGTRAVAEGYERVHRVGDSIQEIRDSVERTSMAADAILASSQEQVTATEKMAESMNEIRKVADAILENSSVTESTVEEINDICSQLRELFDRA